MDWIVGFMASSRTAVITQNLAAQSCRRVDPSAPILSDSAPHQTPGPENLNHPRRPFNGGGNPAAAIDVDISNDAFGGLGSPLCSATIRSECGPVQYRS